MSIKHIPLAQKSNMMLDSKKLKFYRTFHLLAHFFHHHLESHKNIFNINVECLINITY